MPRPVCLKCALEMTHEKTGAVVQFNALSKNGPYQQWRADTAKCSGCGAVVVFRYADAPSWEAHSHAPMTLERADVIVAERLGR